MRMVALLGLAVLALFVVTNARGELLLGVADNEVASPWGRRAVRALGNVGAVRVMIFRAPDELRPSDEDLKLVEGALATGARVFVTVTGRYLKADAPTGLVRRGAYAGYVRQLVEETGVRDVVVWNEPNYAPFWGAKRLNPKAYERLLATTYDALRGTGARTWAFALERSNRVRWFIRAVAREYRRSGRDRPLFHGVAHHPYPVAGEPWDASHPGTSTFTVGDTGRLLDLLDRAFRETPQCRRDCRFPVAYTEVGWPTQRMHLGLVTPTEQATILRVVADYLGDYPRVVALLNFELRDSDGWPTGLFAEDGTPKPAACVLGPGCYGIPLPGSPPVLLGDLWSGGVIFLGDHMPLARYATRASSCRTAR